MSTGMALLIAAIVISLVHLAYPLLERYVRQLRNELRIRKSYRAYMRARRNLPEWMHDHV